MNIVILYLLMVFIISSSCGSNADVKAQPTENHTPSTYAGFDDIDQEKSRIIFIGDTQSTSFWERAFLWREQNSCVPKKLLSRIAEKNPAFVIHLGDLTVSGSSDRHWAKFDKDNKPILDKQIPYFPIRGNHEYWGSNERGLEKYFLRFPHLNQRKWYSFVFKHIGFIMLDSNFKQLSTCEKKDQHDWYLEELQRLEDSDDIQYILVCVHDPPFTNSKVVKPNKTVVTDYVEPLKDSKKTVLVFSGHCHSYERFGCDSKEHFFVSGGGGGPRQKLYKVGKKKFEDKFQDKCTQGKVRFFHFCQIDLFDDYLEFKVMKLNWDGSFCELDKLSIPAQ